MDEDKIEQLRNQGWKEMSDLLDTHLPVEKDRPFLWWYRLAGAAAIILLVILVRPYLSSEDGISPEVSNLEKTEKVGMSATKGGGMAAGTNEFAGDQEIKSAFSKVEPSDANHIDRSTAHLPVTATPHISNSDSRLTFAGNENLDHPVTGSVTHSTKSIAGHIASLKSDDAHARFDKMRMGAGVVPMLDRIRIGALDNTAHAHTLFPADGDPVQIPHSEKHLGFMVFSEMMWSLSDHFGFLNAGPGVQYKLDKVTLGLSAGAAVPVPRQKVFGSANLNFLEQYNFAEKLYSASDHISVSAGYQNSSVYYENYTMNIGVMVALEADIRMSPRWSIGMTAGWTSFSWDFIQKAVPNQNVAANTDLANLRNTLWYGGIEAGYAVSPHWKAKAGIRFINPVNPQNIGILPSIRMQYEF